MPFNIAPNILQFADYLQKQSDRQREFMKQQEGQQLGAVLGKQIQSAQDTKQLSAIMGQGMQVALAGGHPELMNMVSSMGQVQGMAVKENEEQNQADQLIKAWHEENKASKVIYNGRVTNGSTAYADLSSKITDKKVLAQTLSKLATPKTIGGGNIDKSTGQGTVYSGSYDQSGNLLGELTQTSVGRSKNGQFYIDANKNGRQDEGENGNGLDVRQLDDLNKGWNERVSFQQAQANHNESMKAEKDRLAAGKNQLAYDKDGNAVLINTTTGIASYVVNDANDLHMQKFQNVQTRLGEVNVANNDMISFLKSNNLVDKDVMNGFEQSQAQKITVSQTQIEDAGILALQNIMDKNGKSGVVVTREHLADRNFGSTLNDNAKKIVREFQDKYALIVEKNKGYLKQNSELSDMINTNGASAMQQKMLNVTGNGNNGRPNIGTINSDSLVKSLADDAEKLKTQGRFR